LARIHNARDAGKCCSIVCDVDGVDVRVKEKVVEGDYMEPIYLLESISVA